MLISHTAVRHTALIVLVATVAAGPLGTASPSNPTRDLEVAVVADNPLQASTAGIVLRLEVTNTGTQSVRLSFRSSQRVDFEILDAQGHVAWLWSRGRVFTMAMGSLVLEAGASHTYTRRVHPSLSAGQYKVVGSLVLPGHPITATSSLIVP